MRKPRSCSSSARPLAATRPTTVRVAVSASKTESGRSAPFRALHRADDVAALAHRSQRRLRLGRNRPTSRGMRLSQAELVQHLQAPDQQSAFEPLVSSGRHVAQVDEAVAGVFGELPVKPGPALLTDLAGHALAHFQLGLRAEQVGGEIGGAAAQPVADVVASDDEVVPGVIDAAQNDMAVRIVGIPVIDRDPVELRAEVRFHARHQVARVSLQIADLSRVLGRDDEPELVPVAFDARLERLRVGDVPRCGVGLARFTFAGDAVALDVAKVGAGRARRGLGVNHKPRLDHDAPGPRPKASAKKAGSDMAASLFGTATGAARKRASRSAASLLRSAEHLAGEALGSSVPVTADLARPWAEMILVRASHDASSSVPSRVRHANSRFELEPSLQAQHRAHSGACRANRRADQGERPAACRGLLSCPRLPPLPHGLSSSRARSPVCTSVSSQCCR